MRSKSNHPRNRTRMHRTIGNDVLNLELNSSSNLSTSKSNRKGTTTRKKTTNIKWWQGSWWRILATRRFSRSLITGSSTPRRYCHVVDCEVEETRCGDISTLHRRKQKDFDALCFNHGKTLNRETLVRFLLVEFRDTMSGAHMEF